MTLNASGPISIGGSTSGQSINLELGRAAGAQSSMGETDLRTLAGVASGPIDLQDFYGKSAADQIPDAVNWADISGETPQQNASQTMQGFTGTLTLRVTMGAVVAGSGARTFHIYKNGASAVSLSGTGLVTGATMETSITSGDTIYFYGTKGGVSPAAWSCNTVTITIVETGNTIDTFAVVTIEAPP